ncbi:MAG: hypothetical protein MZV70_68555 [Desulfobacterales bacterium]|nr:hypothetical protein [Desulfobacterales bacterium]
MPFCRLEGEFDRIREEKLKQERETVMPVDECTGPAMRADSGVLTLEPRPGAGRGLERRPVHSG